MAHIEKIISGGQTGADRAALDWAIENTIAHGGWCPKGRHAEDGMISDRYRLEETPEDDYEERTMWNVRDADATLIVTVARPLTGGTLRTRQDAERIGRPWLHVTPSDDWRQTISRFFQQHPIRVLNVAGPRDSEESGIRRFVQEVLNEMKAIGLFGKPPPRAGRN